MLPRGTLLPLLLALALALVAATAHGRPLKGSLPIFEVSGTNYEVGKAIGTHFAAEFKAFMASFTYMNSQLLPFYQSPDGRQIVDHFLDTATRYFPDYVQEMQGMADGSGIPYEQIVLMNVQDEIFLIIQNNTNSSKLTEACSDIHVGGPNGEILVGHNEDGDAVDAAGSYILKANITGGGAFVAFCYPCVLPGNAFGFNSYQVGVSFNALFPKDVRLDGIPRQFVNRDLLDSYSVEDAMDRLLVGPVASGFSANLGSLAHGGSVNIEVAPGRYMNPLQIRRGSHYYHFNQYLRLLNVPRFPDISSDHRLARAQELPVPTDAAGIFNILGDNADKDYPIFRNGNPPDTDAVTLASALYNYNAGTVSIYQGNPKTVQPFAVFNLTTLSTTTA